jgi:two-component system, response regulator
LPIYIGLIFSAVESGKRNLTLGSIQRLAAALGASVASFFVSMENGSSEARLEEGDGSADQAGEILLVEDDPNDVQYLLRAFKAAKVANPVQVVSDGAAALEYLASAVSGVKSEEFELPRVVLLDLQLPKIHGLEVLRRVKADRRLRQVPIVVLTGSHSDRDMQEAMRLGANAYLIKPVDFQRFA